MKRFFTMIVLLLLATACMQGNNERGRWMTRSDDRIKVLSTVAMINDLVNQVGGERVDTAVLIHGELDPHSYQLVKGDDELLAFADLILFNGLNLEHGASLQKVLYENKKAVALGDGIAAVDPSLILYYNGQIDPHIWMDVSLWAKTVPLIVKALSAQDPVNAYFFEENGRRLIKELNAFHNKLYADLQQVPEEKRFLVTSHDAFNYFARAYLATDEEIADGSWQKRFAAPEGLSPDSQLSTYDIKLIVDHLKEHHIQILFPESNLSRDSIVKIVEAGREKGLDLYIAKCPLYADAMGPRGSDGDTYLKMVGHNAKLIALYLRDYNPPAVTTCE